MEQKHNSFIFRKFDLFYLIFAVSFCVSGCSDAGLTNQNKNDDSVYFEDARLEKVVREALGLGQNELVTIEGLASLTKLDASMHGIKSIEGLQNASGLIELNLA
jgi:hypothetical protein